MTNRKSGEVHYPKELVARLKELKCYPDPQAWNSINFYSVSEPTELDRLVITDGVNDMCEQLKCYWLVDHLGSVMPELTDAFYVVYVVKNNDQSFYFILDDGNNNIIHCERHPLTNIKCNLRLYLSRDELWVLMLPSEY